METENNLDNPRLSLIYIIARVVFWLLGMSSVFVYLFFCFLGFKSSQHMLYSDISIWMKINFWLNTLVFIPGLTVMLITTYFFLYVKDLQKNMIGIFVVILLITVHLLVEGAAAHAEPIQGFIIQLIEVIISIAL